MAEDPACIAGESCIVMQDVEGHEFGLY